MPKKLRLAFVAALVVAGFTVLPGSALADGRSQPAPTYASISGEAPTWSPGAHAACPFCVFAVAAAVRAALVIRAARAARAIQLAIVAARASARAADKLTRAGIRRIQTQAGTISRRGASWTKKHWPTFAVKTKACLSTAAFMETGKYLADRKITAEEWSRYVIFGPRLVPQSESLTIVFPIRFTARELAGKAAETAISCAVGAGFARHFGKGADAPTPG